MKLENQVVSLELAKQLKELGFEQESLFYYVTYESGIQLETHKFCCDCSCPEKMNEPNYPAYTVAELGEMLPDKYYSKKLKNKFTMFKGLDFVENTFSDTEADARARMIIYLKENNLLNKK